MTLEELISPGDKIDIRLLYQLEQERAGNDVEVKTYKSSTYDYLSDTELEIAMPTENGKMVLFQTGLRCEFIFYTNRGLYMCTGIVKKRYKKDFLFALAVEIKTPPSKFQRREFFRVDCLIDMKYYKITEEVASLDSTEKLFAEIQGIDYIGAALNAVVQDISGGGIRFTTDEQLEVNSYLLIVIRLANNKMDETFYLPCKLISSNKIEHAVGKYSNRGKFIFKDIKDRETIVRFVFEEERRIRKKELGEGR